ncbi:hypothetical protein N7490_001327 [Penicillium lividum]|nr:hypothetical protein N7490_001327 [Penicillium lividum]
MNGMTIGYAEENLASKSITIRTGDRGAMQFNITDGSTLRRKAYYQGSSYSDTTHSGHSSHQLLEDERRAAGERNDRRSKMSFHPSSPRSSRSGGYSRRYWV